MRLPLAFAETPIPFFVKSLARYHSRHGWKSSIGEECTVTVWYLIKGMIHSGV